mmetsp:Transcript_20071/g.24808  ORF Transcript_20071/g.24808 Transcript_20071/m.24808 type:complete len:169 (-) Transcript_20071:111-617(-)|eukprot:CAMPEP_0172514258 /NCGR_PEP_ID=MMETSP1066-20121228/258702_1 /TAXON_ID=671091 /ORGANISM="Coscinodiscus wailesii, Strain CCMP2513" /LENGTH=168 /DNA_ID=CAMNT_0013294853 /DNA_START=139 /DNA_END=645 /DNA_ORIENTATION=-
MFTIVALRFTTPRTTRKIGLLRLFSSGKPYVRPPTYKEQVQQGVPLGKRKFYGRESHTAMQAALGISLFIAFVATPFLGKRLARDEEFRKLIPNWYNYKMEVPANAMSREEMHEQLISMQRDLHERAIRGDFTPDKVEKMDTESITRDPHGWGKIHPGLGEDYDEEDE